MGFTLNAFGCTASRCVPDWEYSTNVESVIAIFSSNLKIDIKYANKLNITTINNNGEILSPAMIVYLSLYHISITTDNYYN